MCVLANNALYKKLDVNYTSSSFSTSVAATARLKAGVAISIQAYNAAKSLLMNSNYSHKSHSQTIRACILILHSTRKIFNYFLWT